MANWEDFINRADSRKIWIVEIELARDDGLGGLEINPLRLSDDAIHPDLMDVYYEPRLKDIPSYKERIQELRQGESQISWGQLRIINNDGQLDSLVNGWGWLGRPVVISQGFEGLHVSGFREVVTGRAADFKPDDDLITITVEDLQGDLWDAKLSPGDYTDTVPNLVSTCLTAAGISSIDTAMWNTWATAHVDWPGFVQSSGDEGTSVGRILDQIIPPLCCVYGFDRQGRFWVSEFTAPDASAPVLSLADDLELLDYGADYWEQSWRVVVEYLSSTPSTYASVNRHDSAIKALNGTAKILEKRTCLTSQAKAVIARDRWWALTSVPRKTIKAKAKLQPLALRLIDQVSLARSRYALAGNRRAMGFEHQWADNQVIMELFA